MWAVGSWRWAVKNVGCGLWAVGRKAVVGIREEEYRSRSERGVCSLSHREASGSQKLKKEKFFSRAERDTPESGVARVSGGNNFIEHGCENLLSFEEPGGDFQIVTG